MSNDWLLDIGHTRVKWARAGADPADSAGTLARARLAEWAQAETLRPGDRLWLPRPADDQLAAFVKELAGRHQCRLHWVHPERQSLPVRPGYAGWGADRWLAVQWPWQQTGRALCVIDCGTAVTIDLVDSAGRHRGGWILPGLASARAGLITRAPHLDRRAGDDTDFTRPALDTARALARGGVLQLAGGVERALAAGKRALDEHPAAWLTGGDAETLAAAIDPPCRVDPHLVLRGLAMAVTA